MTQNIDDEQKQLLQRIEQLTRFIKRAYRYRGSKDTHDMAGLVQEKLLRSPDLRRKFDEEPSKLRGLLRIMISNVFKDEFSRLTAQINTQPPGDQFRVEWQAQYGRGKGGATPDLERDTQRRQDVQRVMAELERFRLGQDDSRMNPRRRARMHQALLLHWEGHTHHEIAKLLGVPQATVGYSITALSVLLARRIAVATAKPETQRSRRDAPACGNRNVGALLDAVTV